VTKQNKRRIFIEGDAESLAEIEARLDAKIEELRKTNFKIKAITDYERAMSIMEAVTLVIQTLDEEQFIICTPVFDRYFQEVLRLAPPRVLKADTDFVQLVKLVHDAAKAVTQAEHEVIRAQRLELKRRLRPVQGLSTEAPLCTRCGKRQQHFGTLCKRCADETGERPRGKI